MRVTLSRLVLAPLALVAVVVAVPYVAGDQPITWDAARRFTLTQVGRLPGHPLAGQLDDDGGTSPIPVPVPAATASAVDEPYPVHPVGRPWAPGSPELGVQVYWVGNGTDTERTVWTKAQRIVDYVTGLGANAMAVSFPFFTPGMQATSVGAGRGTPSPHQVEVLAHEAALAGLRVTVRPILDEKSLHPPDGWRGSIRPDSVPAWFDSYRAFLLPYLSAAERQRVASFVVGTELNSMEPHPQWRELVAAAHDVFSGRVVYDLNYDNYGRGLFPAGMDGYGVDGYIKVKAPDGAPPSAVAADWNAFLAAANRSAPSAITLSEVGIAARRGAFANPGDFTSTGAYDARTQPTWYRGVCAVARQHRFTGLYFWKVDFDADPLHPKAGERPTFDFIGRPASEGAIRECLAAPWSVPAAGEQPTPSPTSAKARRSPGPTRVSP